MSEDSKFAWGEGLRQHVIASEQGQPVPAREQLSELEEQQCRILGGHLIGWIEEWGPPLLAERSVIAGLNEQDPDPLIVVLTTNPGLVAARQIISPEELRVISCRPEDYSAYLKTAPDEKMVFHCTLETFFETLTPETEQTLRSEHELQTPAPIGVHYDCTTMGPLFARGGRHLWSFEPDKSNLVAEAFETWVS